MQVKKTICLIACTCLLTACAASAATQFNMPNNKEEKSGIKFSPIAHARTAELLHFFSSYSQQDDHVQKETYKKVMLALAENSDDIQLKIQQAAMLSLPDSHLRDSKKARAMLQALLIDQEIDESDMNLVKLLYSYTNDYLSQQEKILDHSKNAESLKQSNKALKRKLDEIKNIEKTMIERNTKTSNTP